MHARQNLNILIHMRGCQLKIESKNKTVNHKLNKNFLHLHLYPKLEQLFQLLLNQTLHFLWLVHLLHLELIPMLKNLKLQRKHQKDLELCL